MTYLLKIVIVWCSFSLIGSDPGFPLLYSRLRTRDDAEVLAIQYMHYYPSLLVHHDPSPTRIMLNAIGTATQDNGFVDTEWMFNSINMEEASSINKRNIPVGDDDAENKPISTSIRKLPCKHVFHNACLTTLLKYNQKKEKIPCAPCPVCRKPFTKKEMYYQDPRTMNHKKYKICAICLEHLRSKKLFCTRHTH